MTERERYLETILFGKPDKVPLEPGYPRVSTLVAWRTQGLPEDRNYLQVVREILGIPEPPPTKTHVWPGVSFEMIPIFEQKVLEHKDGHYIVQDWMGAITEISDQYDLTYLRSTCDFVTRKWHKFPVENRRDWEIMKERYDATSPERYPGNFKERCALLKDRDYVSYISFNGPFWQLREWCGMEGLCYLMADDPKLVDEMCVFWAEFVSAVMAPLLEKVELDFVQINEDMAYKAHSMISPAMMRRFVLPSYKRWVGEIKTSGCPIVSVDSDGFIGELIPLWIEAGINCNDPVEVAAGNDIVAFRKEFGRNMAYTGGIDKRAMAKGGQALHDEIMRVVPPLLKEGGFIPSCDHGVPPDISWQNYIEHTRLLAQLTGWL
jgi:hypothetical protein